MVYITKQFCHTKNGEGLFHSEVKKARWSWSFLDNIDLLYEKSSIYQYRKITKFWRLTIWTFFFNLSIINGWTNHFLSDGFFVDHQASISANLSTKAAYYFIMYTSFSRTIITNSPIEYSSLISIKCEYLIYKSIQQSTYYCLICNCIRI